MFELFEVVDNKGQRLEGLGRKNKRFYFRKDVADGVATQYNNITVIKNGEEAQLEGAPFRSRRLVVKEA